MNHHVAVHFVGICTHISRRTLHALPARQRVVLVNARDGHLVRATAIPPHEPVVQIGDLVIPLTGCTVRLSTAHSLELCLDLTETFQALPNLTQLVEGLTDLSAPSPKVVLDRNVERSACYFDIDFGSLSACLDRNGAAVATLEVNSPEPVSLEITPWDSSSPIAHYPLDHGSIVWVANIDRVVESTAHPFVDFLLHYLTAEKMPETPQVPQSIALPQCDFHHPYQTVGAGCSNSNYP